MHSTSTDIQPLCSHISVLQLNVLDTTLTVGFCEQAAQQIVVLDGGRVAEIGTHDGLVEKNGLYAELVSTQSLSLSLSV